MEGYLEECVLCIVTWEQKLAKGLLNSIGKVLVLKERELAFDILKWFDKERSLVCLNNQRKRRITRHASNVDQSSFASILPKI